MDNTDMGLPPEHHGALLAPMVPEELVPAVPEEIAATLPPEGRLRKALHAANYAIKSAVITAELLPITNEGSRYGAFAATEVVTHNPVIGAAVLGGSTLLVEGAGAIAASDLITGSTGNKLFDWLNKKLEKIVPPDAKMSRTVEAGIAMTAGTPLLLAAQQRQAPNRTAQEAKKQGLLTATWMAGVFAVEGALLSMGIDNYTDPKTVGAALLGTGAIMALPSWAKKALRSSSKESVVEEIGGVTGVTAGGELTEAQVKNSAGLYETFRGQQDEAVKVGLYGEDLERVLNSPASTLLEYATKKDGTHYMPLLVPAEELKWYNMAVLKGAYGYGKEYYYYAHPPIHEDHESRIKIADALKEKLDRGAIIFTDQYVKGQEAEAFSLIANPENTYTLANLAGGDTQRTGEVFTGPVNFVGAEEIKAAPSISEIYQQMVDDKELGVDAKNGVALVETIEGEEAERIWEIYKAPFDDLSEEHPMYAGFSKEELMDILVDPTVAKLVNRVDGTISTLCFFVDDFDHCPWFNRDYYSKKYPEYYDTNNILMFPGIVTDQNMRGNDYAMKVIDLATNLYAKRGSNVLVTFECTETSAIYIPTIVKMAIEHSGQGKITGIEQPDSVTEYKALRRI